jgi:hypothetical protein
VQPDQRRDAQQRLLVFVDFGINPEKSCNPVYRSERRLGQDDRIFRINMIMTHRRVWKSGRGSPSSRRSRCRG